MDEGARRWLVQMARKNQWRVAPWIELDDLIQEGYAAYYRTMQKYPEPLHPSHRMALFKQTYFNRLHDLANRRTRGVPETCMVDFETEDGRSTVLENYAASADLGAALPALACAPQYVKDALALFGSEDGLRRLRHKARRSGPGRHRRETLNERLCRLTGHDPAETDIVGAIRACLT